MSTYFEVTKHPRTGEWERALWIDDYFGRHNYGVKFLDGQVFDPRLTKLQRKPSLTEPTTPPEEPSDGPG